MPELGYIKATDPSKVPEAAKTRTDTMVLGITDPQGIFNYWFYNSAYDRYVIESMIERLVSVDKDASLIPGLAEKWEISNDGLTYTFHIDKRATFSDGKPVTAEDVAFAYHVLLDPTYDGRSNLSLAKIKGGEAYKKGDATSIEGVKVIDQHTLQVEVEEANATTLIEIGANIFVLPKHIYGKDFAKGKLDYIKSLHQKPVGSGPYILKEYIPGQEVRLVANENYWKGAPKVKNLIFKTTTQETQIQSLKTGVTDFDSSISVNADNVEALKELGFVDLDMLLNNGYGYIAVNHKNPKFQDKRVRQALMYGLNREEVVYAYSQGYANVIDVPQSKLSWSYPDESKITKYEYNLEKAKQLLDEAGWKLESDGYRYKDGKKFTIQFSASTPNEVNDALIPIAVENYKELGIEFIPEQLEFNAVVEKRNKGEHEMAFLAVGLSVDPDPYSLFHTNGGSNKDGYSNPKVDELIMEGLKEFDQSKRKAIYQEVYQILNDDVPVIFMYQRYNLNTISARLSGFVISPYKYFSETLHGVQIN
ncbi:ABC transporter substrate-binding protein [Brevibacillus composti]|uniref:ABC transporter substrate-binding protein n=1 Tax=Brevibacillus composti TaxID=2796470 RepID=A0A7T5EPC9_9BACL|nr:ABC transporter substrate-binding protein [Brevibacillus composti]QQE76299.1 ABC transporter substrate-binding protein [Brevibacillus composti]QUO43326.1 ABC transporter substrate-binding protein [Brevibacillus composti]